MKLDKDTLIKHRFWVMLGFAAPLAIIAIFILLVVIGAEISGYRDNIVKKVDAAKNKLKTKFVNQSIIDERATDRKLIESKEHEIWKKAWEQQAYLFTWPDSVEKRFDFQKGLFAKEIKVQRGGVLKAAPEPMVKPDASPEGELRVITGIISQNDKDTLEVKTADEKLYLFNRTAGLDGDKIDDGGKKEIKYFTDLRPGDLVTVRYEVGKYFNDPLSDSEQAEYVKLGAYLTQIEPIYMQVEPIDERGEGVVQLRDWAVRKGQLPPGKNRFLRYLAGGWKLRDHDISEEAWLAQQDIWINREIFRIIRQANDYVSEFKGVGGKEKGTAYSFENPYWKIDLKWDGANKLELTMKNRLSRRQKLDIKFRVRTHAEAEPEVFSVTGEPVSPAGYEKDTWSDTIKLKSDLPRTGIYGLSQVLTWETAAVKRIDSISIGEAMSHSHRTFEMGLHSLKSLSVSKESAAPPGKEKPGDRPAAAGDSATPNGLIPNCYCTVTSQTRRLPVVVSLIVDQDHIDRVETSFANSKLRFLVTEILKNRYPGSMRPQVSVEVARVNKGDGKKGSDDKGAPAEIEEAAAAAGGLTATIKSAPPLPGAGGRFVTGRGAGIGPRSSGDDMEANVEMVIYGIATIYQRYPPPAAVAPTSPAPAPVAAKK